MMNTMLWADVAGFLFLVGVLAAREKFPAFKAFRIRDHVVVIPPKVFIEVIRKDLPVRIRALKGHPLVMRIRSLRQTPKATSSE